MSWSEFCTLLSGIMPETPLGQIVNIRSENDKDILKNFTREQHRIRNEWRNRRTRVVSMNKKEMKEQVKMFQNAMKQAFS